MVRAQEESNRPPMFEQMESADLGSFESTRKTMRVCTCVGVAMCVLVVLASIMLWDNVGMGPKSKGIRQAATAKKMQERKVKRILAQRALDLSEQAAIADVANTYAPQSWFASHKRPERAAILAVTRNPREGDKIVDQVEGEMLDTHYKGQRNSVAQGVKDLLPGMSRRRRNEIIEPLVEAGTQRALHRLSLEAGKGWVDRGLGERKLHSGWITDQVKSAIVKPGERERRVRTSHEHAHQVRPSRQRSGSMHLPGLGDVKSAQEAAKALEHLARKRSGSSRGRSDEDAQRDDQGQEDNGHDMGLDHPKHTLHAALSKRGLSEREGLDLHQALERRRGQRVRSDDDDQGGDRGDDEGRRQDQKYIRKMASKELRGEDDWDDSSRTAPVGQSIQTYFSKGNQDWMNAAGAWGAGA
ncbi:hypothetical protein GUITHDRAFT_112624 [Guillardia theta CCMP2712]|uniref:Transmembrane protein n=1 Tax=Guillardia theta (strain CCMP2712) TaxID=905079 RepID=L1IZA4_GUITC|nr:hypothetical protein GUITHDRAFT_112624 [Guillardia theta CCMP2712]EKX41407.1 hypothetical protein GUITHDRAFT_112624 [Guillardia theta CCMP2712]|eukprot:XP_005828387.1 hypothetical protein GUITHDRAFT_112624 [Guillardia theta CCMP2712]